MTTASLQVPRAWFYCPGEKALTAEAKELHEMTEK